MRHSSVRGRYPAVYINRSATNVDRYIDGSTVVSVVDAVGSCRHVFGVEC